MKTTKATARTARTARTTATPQAWLISHDPVFTAGPIHRLIIDGAPVPLAEVDATPWGGTVTAVDGRKFALPHSPCAHGSWGNDSLTPWGEAISPRIHGATARAGKLAREVSYISYDGRPECPVARRRMAVDALCRVAELANEAAGIPVAPTLEGRVTLTAIAEAEESALTALAALRSAPRDRAAAALDLIELVLS